MTKTQRVRHEVKILIVITHQAIVLWMCSMTPGHLIASLVQRRG